MSMDPKRLWAKSKRDDEPERQSMYLGQHLKDVYHAAERILEATGESQLCALKLDVDDYLPRFRRCVLAAAALHDLGKANDHFQSMLRQTPERMDRPQGLRHEWVTILMLQRWRDWLREAVGGNEIDTAFVEWAVSGHHPGHNHESPPRNCPAGAGDSITLYMGHTEFGPIVSWLCTTFGGSIPPSVNETRRLVNADNVYQELAKWWRNAQRLWQTRVENQKDARLVAAIKNCLIAADVAGSALPREISEESTRWNWITDSLGQVPSAGDLAFLAKYGLEGKDPREFQKAVAEDPAPVVFVKAGCGSGKTVAAYLRAAKQYAGRRLYFCYPTTGTATEGFKDYLHPEIPEKPSDDTPKRRADRERLRAINADLFHSRSAVDFEMILGTGDDAGNPHADAAARLESLQAWCTPVVACTVDSVLGIVQNNKRGLFAWPALAQSAFVFDEIHAYDDRLFGALLRFLRDLPGLPVLLMTASLPKAREEVLREIVREVHGKDLLPIPGPEGLEKLPRYFKEPIRNNDPTSRVRQAIHSGEKVLWVCNTVQRVMDAAESVRELSPTIYHSRFKYADRVQRHAEVINAFKNPGPALAICTQVAEMSLDLSADLLVTDLAPVPALIQRLGRLNRRAQDGSPTKPFVIVQPEKHLPYSPNDVSMASNWLEKLPAKNISQRDLAEAWEQDATNLPDLVPSAWLDGGPTTTVSELREASPGITVLMESDVAKIRRLSDVGKYTIPMPPPPRNADWKRWAKCKGIPVAPSGWILFDEMRGAEWKRD